ncbi:DNA adenine methylase [Longimicrobium sp.]|uniref:DNA adenine methylase n=1 Tax=Longimicrobium sp. TaxID=2029185 RepID=UPI0039C924B3
MSKSAIRTRPEKIGGPRPFLRWPGGKRWAAPTIAKLIEPALRCRYIEPFLGGGAVFFHLRPGRALLADLNSDLVETYVAIRDRPQEIVRILEQWTASENTFYSLRGWKPTTPLERAARFLFLNRTSFAGIYRENRDGDYNVPFGGGARTHRILIDTDLLSLASEALNAVELVNVDFEATLDRAGIGDVVYCDPPYPPSRRGGFERYNGRPFSWADHVRLSEAAHRAKSRGSLVIISNGTNPEIEELYADADIRVLERGSQVSRTVSGRGRVRELLFILQPTR